VKRKAQKIGWKKFLICKIIPHLRKYSVKRDLAEHCIFSNEELFCK
jgi:hypothetical protein